MANTYLILTPKQLYENYKNWFITNPSPRGAYNLNDGSIISSLGKVWSIEHGKAWHSFIINLRKAQFSSVMDSFGFSKLAGYQASGTLVFSCYVAPLTDITIPIGTRVIAVNGKTFQTTTIGTIYAGTLTSTIVNAECVDIGELGNIYAEDINTVAGKGSMYDKITGVDNVINSSAFAGGSETESDSDQVTRFEAGIVGLTRTTDAGLLRGTREVTGVRTASIAENQPYGTVLIIAADNSGTLSPTLRTTILTHLTGTIDSSTYKGAGITIDVQAPSIYPVNINVTVYRLETGQSLTDAALALLIKSKIEQYVNSRSINQDVILSKIDEAVHQAHPEVYKNVITLPTADISIIGNYLARTGGTSGGLVTVTIATYVET